MQDFHFPKSDPTPSLDHTPIEMTCTDPGHLTAFPVAFLFGSGFMCGVASALFVYLLFITIPNIY